MHIRGEGADDKQAIHALVAEAFGRRDEADLVDALRSDGDLVLSLVVGDEGGLAGHIALSRLKSPGQALALAPVTVSPSKQRRGIGSALVRAAIERATALGCQIVFVLGKPDYYMRFGFSAETAAPYPCPYAGPYFMARTLTDVRPLPAPVIYAPAFDDLE